MSQTLFLRAFAALAAVIFALFLDSTDIGPAQAAPAPAPAAPAAVVAPPPAAPAQAAAAAARAVGDRARLTRRAAARRAVAGRGATSDHNRLCERCTRHDTATNAAATARATSIVPIGAT